MRIILAGIAGGIAMFIWSFCSHTVLPLAPTKNACLTGRQVGVSQTTLNKLADPLTSPGKHYRSLQAHS